MANDHTFPDGQPAAVGVQPLFLLTKDQLKAKLRLSGAAASDALAIIDHAIQRVRAGFHQYVSPSRIGDVVSTLPVDNAITTEQIIRSMAMTAETLWVRLILMQEMPQLWIDGSGNTSYVWNQEGLTRESPFNKEKELERLWRQIQDILDQIESGQPGSDRADGVGLIAPGNIQPRPGATVGIPWRYPSDRVR